MKGRSRRAGPAKATRGRESKAVAQGQLPDIRAFLAPAQAASSAGGTAAGTTPEAEATPSPWLRRPDPELKKATKTKKKRDGDEDDNDAALAWTDLPAPVAAFQLPPFLFRASGVAAASPSTTSGGDEPSEEVEDASLSSTWDGSPPASPSSDDHRPHDVERQCGGLVVRLKAPSTATTTTTYSPQQHDPQPLPQSINEDEEGEEESANDHAHGRDLCRDKLVYESDGRAGKAQPAGAGKGGSGILEGEARHLRVLRQHVAHHSFFRQHDAAERAKNDVAQGQNRLFDLWDSLAPATTTASNPPSLPHIRPGVPSSTAASLSFAQQEATTATTATTEIAAKAGRSKREQKDGEGEKTTPLPPKEPPRAQVGSFSFAFTLPSSSPAAAAPPARKRTKKPTTTTAGPKGTAKRKRTTDAANPTAE